MRYAGILVLLIVYSSAFGQKDSFKGEQKKFARVRQAYKEKEADMLALLEKHELKVSEFQIYLRAFKQEKEIELWAKNKSASQFTHIKTYEVCQTSGKIGPKRKQGDMQIPEGFYHIDRFNPHSNFYLSLGVNYPNKSDRILGVSGSLGGDIFIHGDCVTVGCLPITDNQIKDLYIFCVEARNNGQERIPVTIFPAQLTDATFKSLITTYASDTDKTGLWTDLKQGYDFFNEHKRLPNIGFLSSGRHQVEK